MEVTVNCFVLTYPGPILHFKVLCLINQTFCIFVKRIMHLAQISGQQKERSPLVVLTVRKRFQTCGVLLSTQECTQEKNPIVVPCVLRLSLHQAACSST